MTFSFCIIIGHHYVAYLQLMGGNLFLRKRNGKVSMQILSPYSNAHA